MSYVFWMWPGRERMEEGGERIPGKTLQLSLPSQVWSVSALVLNSETHKSQVRVSPMGKPSFLLILHQPCYYLGPQYVRFPSIDTPEDVERQTCEDQQTKEPSVMDKRQWLLGGYSYSRPKSHSEQWKEDDRPIRGMRELRPQSPLTSSLVFPSPPLLHPFDVARRMPEVARKMPEEPNTSLFLTLHGSINIIY